MMLHDAVEEHPEEPAVHHSRRPFVCDGKGDAAGGRIRCQSVELVGGKARVERADVECVLQIDAARAIGIIADARRRVGRREDGEVGLPLGEPREHVVDGRVRVFERQQQAGEPAHRGSRRDGLWQRLFAEAGAVGHPSPRSASHAESSIGGLSLLSYTG